MGKLRTKLVQLLRDEEGQSTMEYILILFAVVMIALRFRKQIAEKVSDATDKVGAGIDDALEDFD